MATGWFEVFYFFFDLVLAFFEGFFYGVTLW